MSVELMQIVIYILLSLPYFLLIEVISYHVNLVSKYVNYVPNLQKIILGYEMKMLN